MSASLRELVNHILDSMDERKEYQSLDADTQLMLDKALDRVIEGTDTRIRAVPGYRRKLYKSILKSLEYVDRIVRQIPHPIDLTPKHFVTDPYIRALFPTMGGMQRVFKQSSELHDYFSDAEHINMTESCALLCMRKEEQMVLGMELQGDTVRKDVQQIRVSFVDHRVYSPAETEANTRMELKCCLFEGLINNALDKISQLCAKRHQLEVEQQRLRSRLRHKGRNETISDTLGQFSERDLAGKKLELELEKVEASLNEIGFISPELCLNIVNDTLNVPENFVRFKNISIDLDKQGIKRQDSQSKLSVSHLNFSEVDIKGYPPRVVTLAKFNRDELEKPDLIRGAELI